MVETMHSRLARGVLLLALATYATVVAGSEGTVRESMKYYDISGATAQQLRYALNRSGPVAGIPS